MLNKKLKLSPSVLKRFEPPSGLLFLQCRNKACINTDYTSGTIIAALDGTLSVKEVLEILLENNKDVSSETSYGKTRKYFLKICSRRNFLTKLIDEEYANAIRFYLDNTFYSSKKPESAESVDLNLIRPFSNYIKSLAPDDFLFSTPLFAWWDFDFCLQFQMYSLFVQ